jgi:hypothetical protein
MDEQSGDGRGGTDRGCLGSISRFRGPSFHHLSHFLSAPRRTFLSPNIFHESCDFAVPTRIAYMADVKTPGSPTKLADSIDDGAMDVSTPPETSKSKSKTLK